jgi:copper(I)-binding protein
MRLLASLALLLLMPGTAGAGQFSLDDLTVAHPWLRATIGNLRNTAGYMTIENAGDVPQRLVAVEISGAERIEIHETRDGMMMLVTAVEIPGGGSVTFQPNGWHLMVGPLAAALQEGNLVDGALVFEPAGRIAVRFLVAGANATAYPERE